MNRRSQPAQLQRFWCSPNGQIRLNHLGFLDDPEAEWGRFTNPDVQPVDLLAPASCLVVLGEPGSGKSTLLESGRSTIEERLKDVKQEVLWLDLHEVGSDAQLWRRLFDSPQFKSWKQGEQVLNLFLDSLDECRVQINTLPALLVEEFRQCPIDRLRLRIACRTADWPPSLSLGLIQLWGEDAVQVFELAPLRREDVLLAATDAGIPEPEVFVAAVIQASAVPLAIKPLTLDLLLRTYARHGSLPARRADLYHDGCRLLCEESERRQELRLPRNLRSEQHLAVAGRIAALTVFANRAAVATQVDRGDLADEDLALRDLYGGVETDYHNSFEVGALDVRDTLSTGLFTSRGEERLGWAHRTYEEFLAAWYVVKQNLALPQIMSLIVHSGDADGKLVPQLHETAAWIASMRSDVFHAILSSEPEVLLRSDVSNVGDEDRAALVAALLAACEHGEWIDRDWGLIRYYARLRHPGLDDQLRSYILDAAKDRATRRIAIQIAAGCDLREIVPDLVAVSLDPGTHLETRVTAAYAVIDLGDEDGKRQLGALISTPVSDDPKADLKGCGLNATWPRHLSSQSLVDALVPPSPNYLGAYRTFLERNPFLMLPHQDLPLALKWAVRYANRPRVADAFESLVDTVVRSAWANLDVPGVLSGLVELIWVQFRQSRPIVETDIEALLEDTDKRRLVLVAVMALSSSDVDARDVASSELVRPDDAVLLLDQYQNSVGNQKKYWAYLLVTMLRYGDQAGLDAAWTASQSDLPLRKLFEPLFGPVEIDSDEAREQKERYQRRMELIAKRSQEQPAVHPSPGERVQRLLVQFNEGDLSAWWQLNFEMTLEPQATHYGNEFESDLTVLPGWRDASDQTRAELLVAAGRYVREAIPSPETWTDWTTNISIHRPDWAGFRAIRLLQAQAPGLLHALSRDIWIRWAPVIVAYPMFDINEDHTWYQDLVALAYSHAPDEVLATFIQRIFAENARNSPYVENLLWQMVKCWDERLVNAIVALVPNPDLLPNVMGELLETLLDLGADAAQEFALSLVSDPLPLRERDRTRATIAAALLIKWSDEVGWSVAWQAMQKDPEFAERVLKRLVWRDQHTANSVTHLGSDRLADLYIWISRVYPPAEDPPINGVVEFRAAVGQWRDALLTTLRAQGTEAACAAIARLILELPEQAWLKWTLIEARKLTRQRTWIPPHPGDIRELVQSESRRLIHNADQLLDVVVESLVRLEEALQLGEPPAAIDLWSEVERGRYRPLDEKRLSDYLKRHLDVDLGNRGIVVNREVESRRGEESDIRVEALVRGTESEVSDLVSVIVEAKGCWHPELASAMETQLVGRYLREAKTKHGLYVVGWYNCEKWDTKDGRKQRAPRYDKAEAQRRLDVQANDLTVDGIYVRALVLDTSLRY